MRQELVVITSGGRNPNMELYGHRHHPALVVVGVFAYKVHASGSTVNSRPLTEQGVELLLHFL